MKITNNTSYNITLVNGEVIEAFSSKKIYSLNEELKKQIKKLEDLDVIKISLY